MTTDEWMTLGLFTVGSIISLAGFFIVRILGMIKELYAKNDERERDHNKLSLEVAKNYYSKAEIKALVADLKEFLNERFTHLENRIR